MTAVLDAAALMALMLGEPGADAVIRIVRGSAISAVNLSECCARGVERGATPDDVLAIVRSLEVRVMPFELDDALATARLRETTRMPGIGIGDRTCMALGQRLALPIYTADRRMAAAAQAIGLDARTIR